MLTLQDDTFGRIASLMHESIGLHLVPTKKSLVSSRLGPRIQRLGLDGFEQYLGLIESGNDPGEFQMAVDLLTTNETYFFREPAHFDLIEQELSGRKQGALHLWSAASSFGDEAYSCAMLLSDLQAQGRIGPDWQILATDISDRVLRSAVAGIYPADRLRHTSAQRLQRYCLQGEGDAEGLVQMRPALRERVQFGQLNLCLPIEPLGPFDIILLRNGVPPGDHGIGPALPVHFVRRETDVLERHHRVAAINDDSGADIDVKVVGPDRGWGTLRAQRGRRRRKGE